ncbi:hypothetical protein PPACK8108_LOCUS7458 [Phakopsora pachyrhizi]|uniref:Uncharacterized protein n=2 Tax=Phakopsora pachyrhizi TaxID=170000 RepID=A0AAV0ASX2_PHAPC|nr:hypothetical protein PPACK8108_LOCUS7458 [Phakopsora pachyrhizi]
MLQDYLYWCQTPSILILHKIRFYCHMLLVLTSIVLLVTTSIVLGYSLKMYYGTVLHSIPELLTGSASSLILLGMAWLPSNELPGAYGLNFTRYVWQELTWSITLSLGIFAGLFSLHESTPGLMSDCGRFFICRGYISVFLSAWIAWFLSAIPTTLLITSVMFQIIRRGIKPGSVLRSDISRFEYFWPSQSSVGSKPRINSIYPIDIDRLSRIQPGIEEFRIEEIEFEDEKKRIEQSKHLDHPAFY